MGAVYLCALPYPPRGERSALDSAMARLVSALRCAVTEAPDRGAALAGARCLLGRFTVARTAGRAAAGRAPLTRAARVGGPGS
jgi:hypothetical protein